MYTLQLLWSCDQDYTTPSIPCNDLNYLIRIGNGLMNSNDKFRVVDFRIINNDNVIVYRP